MGVHDAVDDVASAERSATFTPEKLRQAGGYRYRLARRPDLYGSILAQPYTPEQKVVWLDGKDK